MSRIRLLVAVTSLALLVEAAAQTAPSVISAPAGTAPSDAIVLFSGTIGDAWEPPRNDDNPQWKVTDATLVATPGAGNLRTKASFGHVQLHLEFRTPMPPQGEGLKRGNSGVLFMGRYELQILDSYENPVDSKRQSAAISGQFPPLVNASRPPGEWQTLDVLFYAPRPRDGSVLPARMTVLHNGVLVQNDTILLGQTIDDIGYERHPEKQPLELEEAGSPVAFRNIWVREIAIPDSGKK